MKTKQSIIIWKFKRIKSLHSHERKIVFSLISDVDANYKNKLCIHSSRKYFWRYWSQNFATISCIHKGTRKWRREFKSYNPLCLFVEQFFSILATEPLDISVFRIYFTVILYRYCCWLCQFCAHSTRPYGLLYIYFLYFFSQKNLTINNHLCLFLLFSQEMFTFLLGLWFLCC